MLTYSITISRSDRVERRSTLVLFPLGEQSCRRVSAKPLFVSSGCGATFTDEHGEGLDSRERENGSQLSNPPYYVTNHNIHLYVYVTFTIIAPEDH